jgi:Secretion system C-terminal sorting domain
MKKLLFSFFLALLVSFQMAGQITQEGTYNNIEYQQTVRFSDYGDKYLMVNVTPNINGIPNTYISNYYLYNIDGSLFKTFNFPFNILIPEVNNLSDYQLFSDNLFDTDNEIEFLVWNNNQDSLRLIDEYGNIEYQFPLGESNGICLTKVTNSLKLVINYSSPNKNVIVYSLPGTLPCDPCSGLNGIAESYTGGIGEMKVYPNPFNNTLQVNYDFPTNQSNPRLVLTDILGRELKEIKLTSQSDNVSINTTDLPKGTIIVSLYGGQNMISKKAIKIE